MKMFAWSKSNVKLSNDLLKMVIFLAISWSRHNSCSGSPNSEKGKGKLKLVHVIFRHGDISPVNLYPNDHHKASEWGPQGLGQLTQKGMQQQYDLGEYLRHCYKELLSEQYLRSEIYVRSTDTDRTLMSASSNLAGLYPNRNTSWQPVPVHTVAKERDYLLLDAPCARYDHEVENVKNSHEYRMITQTYKNLTNYVTRKGGYKTPLLSNIWNIYDPLSCEISHEFQIPNWVTPYIFEEITLLKNLMFHFRNWNIAMKKIRGGPLVAEIVGHMKNFSMGISNTTKMFLYSAHDITIVSLLAALNMWDYKVPPFASAVMIELHESTHKQYYIKILYRNDTKTPPYELYLKGCSENCSLEEFEEKTKPVSFLGDWYKECKKIPVELNTALQVGIAMTVIIAVLCVLGAIIICYRSRLKNIPYQQANFNSTNEI